MRHMILGISVMFTSFSASAADLLYEQDFTFNTSSEESVRHQVASFCEAAKNDPNIKIVDIRFSSDGDRYDAKIVCHVAQMDQDIMRVAGKAFQSGLKSAPQNTISPEQSNNPPPGSERLLGKIRNNIYSNELFSVEIPEAPFNKHVCDTVKNNMHCLVFQGIYGEFIAYEVTEFKGSDAESLALAKDHPEEILGGTFQSCVVNASADKSSNTVLATKIIRLGKDEQAFFGMVHMPESSDYGDLETGQRYDDIKGYLFCVMGNKLVVVSASLGQMAGVSLELAKEEGNLKKRIDAMLSLLIQAKTSLMVKLDRLK